MPNGDQGFAQIVFLAQMSAQRGNCQCQTCQLLRKATDGMIAQMLGKGFPTQVANMDEAVRQTLGTQVPTSGSEKEK